MNNNKITEKHIDNLIEKKEFFQFGEKTTICLLTLKNGFEIVGTSACVDKENFNQEIRENLSFENAKNKIWELEGYRLQFFLGKGCCYG